MFQTKLPWQENDRLCYLRFILFLKLININEFESKFQLIYHKTLYFNTNF